jgi:hypothetical protein
VETAKIVRKSDFPTSNPTATTAKIVFHVRNLLFLTIKTAPLTAGTTPTVAGMGWQSAGWTEIR